ncbi:hypothetical protein [Leeuwenhoekiella sp. ZYFB001]|uniref:hypothetical protein n=1 Tax=Leeuwenhoekiella sp. ZYFB001 TaxID=2719912 RepID=UPI0014320E79|nr:hypothetical protein [Leeuwenhoekiella sp. ZYFB001]
MKNYIVFFLKSDGTSDSTSADYITLKDFDSFPTKSEMIKSAIEKIGSPNGRVRFKGISGIIEVSEEELNNWKQ